MKFNSQEEDSILHSQLSQCLLSWTFYRPDIGYVQGMSNLCAMFLLHLHNTFDAFSALSNLILGSPTLTLLYKMKADDVQDLFAIYDDLLMIHQPVLARHLRKMKVFPLLYLLDWWVTGFPAYSPLASMLQHLGSVVRPRRRILVQMYLRDCPLACFRSASLQK